MKGGRRALVLISIGAAFACLLGVASLKALPADASAQAAPGGQEAAAPLVTEKLFRNIQVLKGMPIDTFFDAMGMFAASMGDDCTYCHSKDAVFRHEAFGDATPRIQKARQMIVMMQALNKQYFGGQPRVTCFTCHRGNYSPVNAPRLSLQYGAPDDDPNVMDFPTNTRMGADEIFDRYLKALGGPGAPAKITSLVAKGTYSGFDTGHAEVPVEIFAKAPNQRTWIIHMFNGDSYRVFDGRNGWFAGPDSPAPLVTLASGNLDRARIEAAIAFPATIKSLYKEWRVGRTSIDEKDVSILQGTTPGLLPVNFYFDNNTGLLIRMVRWNETPVGPVPTEINYDDYRDVAGVKMPFTWTASQTYMQMTIKLSGIQPNAQVDAARFVQPPPGNPKP
jgi:photosynthetic reaction center cytochrome c subunit